MIIATQVFFGGKERIFHLRNCDVNMENMKIFSLENLLICSIKFLPFPLTMKIRLCASFLQQLFTGRIQSEKSWCLRNLNFWRIKNGCQSDSSIKFQKRKRNLRLNPQFYYITIPFVGFYRALKNPEKFYEAYKNTIK